jgi:hypothetical protein
MKTQDDAPRALKYVKDVLRAVKNPQRVSSQNAVFYRDTRASIPVIETATLAVNAQIKYLVTYSHPLAETPYAKLQYGFANVDSPINYLDYRYTGDLSDPYKTSWVLVLRNVGSVSTTFDTVFGVVSSAPGTVGVTTI